MQRNVGLNVHCARAPGHPDKDCAEALPEACGKRSCQSLPMPDNLLLVKPNPASSANQVKPRASQSLKHLTASTYPQNCPHQSASCRGRRRGKVRGGAEGTAQGSQMPGVGLEGSYRGINEGAAGLSGHFGSFRPVLPWPHHGGPPALDVRIL